MPASPPKPTTFLPRVIGHAHARASLQAGVESGRMTGSLLLLGPTGVGRTLLARELARALNCKGPRRGGERAGLEGDPAPGALPCGSCGPCGRIERGTFGDLVVVGPEDGAASIKIAQVQEMLVELGLAPVEGRHRVFVIEPAGELTEDAQNALLKGLEEPPERSVLVLIAEREEELLSTITSRCRVVRMAELAPDDVLAVLAGAGITGADALERARWCGGRPGLALSEEGLSRARLASRAVELLAEGAPWKDPMGAVDALAEGVDAGDAEAPVRRARLEALLAALTRVLRDALVSGAVDARMSGAAPGVVAALAARPATRLARAIDHLVKLEEEVGLNVTPTLVLEGLVLGLAEHLAPEPLAQARTASTRGASPPAPGGHAARPARAAP